MAFMTFTSTGYYDSSEKIKFFYFMISESRTLKLSIPHTWYPIDWWTNNVK